MKSGVFLEAKWRLMTWSKLRLILKVMNAWGSGPLKDTSRIGRIWEVPIACDMTTSSCKPPEQAGANATGKDHQTSFQC